MAWHNESRRHSLASRGVRTTVDKPVASVRKPYNDRAGYIASLRSGKNKGWVVIYDSKEAGLDSSDGRYAVVCETHNRILNTKNLPLARQSMKNPDFCEECSGGANGS